MTLSDPKTGITSSDPKTVFYTGKVSDLYDIYLVYEDGRSVSIGPGHVGMLGGNYIKLKIDNETGTIKNWRPISYAMVADALDQ